MNWLQAHLRNKFLAGILASGPIVIVTWAVVWLEQNTQPLAAPLGIHFPGLGIVLALLAVYLLGLIVTSILGRLFLSLADKALERIPGLNQLYRAWKDVLVLPPAKSTMYHQVVLIPAAEGAGVQLGFTNAEHLAGDHYCVFVPGVPNPISGQLVLVKRDACVHLAITAQDAFKFLLSTGNHVPVGMHDFGKKSEAIGQ